jgi:hypothetical protein
MILVLVSYRRLVQLLLRVSLEISRIKVKSDVSKRQGFQTGSA